MPCHIWPHDQHLTMIVINAVPDVPVTTPAAAAPVKSGAPVTASSAMAVMGSAIAGAALLMACPALF